MSHSTITMVKDYATREGSPPQKKKKKKKKNKNKNKKKHTHTEVKKAIAFFLLISILQISASIIRDGHSERKKKLEVKILGDYLLE